MPIKYVTKDGVQEDKTILTPEPINTIASDSNSMYIWAMSNTNLYRIDISSYPAVVSPALKFSTWPGVENNIEHKFNACFIDGDRNLWAIEGRDLYCYNLSNFDVDIVSNTVLPPSLKTITAGSAYGKISVLTITSSRTAVVGTVIDGFTPSTLPMVKIIGKDTNGNLAVITSVQLEISGACEDDENNIWVSNLGTMKKLSGDTLAQSASYGIGGQLMAIGYFDNFIFVYRRDNGTIYKYSKSGTASGSIAGNGSSNFTNSDFTGHIKKNITGGYYKVDSVSINASIDYDFKEFANSGTIKSNCDVNKFDISYIGYSGFLLSNSSSNQIFVKSTQFGSTASPTGLPEESYTSKLPLSMSHFARVKYNETLGPVKKISIPTDQLISYYPLYSDFNDYSGNGFNGASTTAVFDGSSVWIKNTAEASLLPAEIANIINQRQQATICFFVKDVVHVDNSYLGFLNVGASTVGNHHPYNDNTYYFTTFRTTRILFGGKSITERSKWHFCYISTGPAGLIISVCGSSYSTTSTALNIDPMTMFIGKGNTGARNCMFRNFLIYGKQLSLEELKLLERCL